jgi:hypothetical protein
MESGSVGVVFLEIAPLLNKIEDESAGRVRWGDVELE